SRVALISSSRNWARTALTVSSRISSPCGSPASLPSFSRWARISCSTSWSGTGISSSSRSSSSRALPARAARFPCASARAVGHGDVEFVEELLGQRVAGQSHAVALGVGHGLGAQVLLELVDGVDLGSHLGELVVGLGQLPDLDGLRGDLDLGLLAGALATGELGDEGGGLLGRQAGQRLIQALEHVAVADLVGDALDALDLLVVDGGDEVEGDE